VTLPRAGLFTLSLVTFGAFVSCAASGRLPCAGTRLPQTSPLHGFESRPRRASLEVACDARPGPTASLVDGHAGVVASSAGPSSARVCSVNDVFGLYFPPTVPGEDDRDWWKWFLVPECEQWKEPPLWNCGVQRGPDTIRIFSPWGGLLWPRVTRIEKNTALADAGATLRVSSPDLSISDSALVSESDWDGLVDCLNRTGFWTEHTRDVQFGFDGDHPVVEAVIGGRYNVAMHGSFSCPPEPAFFECVSRAAVLARPSMRKVNATQNEWYDRCEKGR
jgi:hypothetical protein